MELGLNGKVVVVTGGATGIGLEMARAFLQEGCKVAICGRRMEKLQKAKEFLGSERVFVYQADMTDLEQVETFAAAVAKEYGSIDVWINNAGAMWIKPLMEMSSEEFRREIDLNLTTVFHGAKAAYPYMKAQGGGVILNASSFAALDPNAGRATYSAAKAAVKNLSERSRQCQLPASRHTAPSCTAEAPLNRCHSGTRCGRSFPSCRHGRRSR